MTAFVPGFTGSSLSLRASSFTSSTVSHNVSKTRVARVSMTASPSVPFLDRPPKLDGSLPGDVGFDPLGFSNKFDINFLREAEVKHGKSISLYFFHNQNHLLMNLTYESI